ncbi:MAG: response regulator [Nitrosomonadales bacterium]
MNPNEVCDLYLKNCYDLILLDLQMPGMDGFQVMEGLKEIESGGYLPVLTITAQPNHKLHALKAVQKTSSASHLSWPKYWRVSVICWKCVCYTRNCRNPTTCWSNGFGKGLPSFATAILKLFSR